MYRVERGKIESGCLQGKEKFHSLTRGSFSGLTFGDLSGYDVGDLLSELHLCGSYELNMLNTLKNS